MSVQLGISVLRLSSSMTLSVDTLGCTVYSVGGVYYYTFHRKSYNSQLYSFMCMTGVVFTEKSCIHQKIWHVVVWILDIHL